MSQFFKFSLVSFAIILAVGLCSNLFAQSSLNDYAPANVSGKSIIDAPMAPVVFLDQAPNGVNGLFADETCALCPSGQQTIADNFAATIATSETGITQLVFWGGYYPEDIPNTTDDFTIIFHANNAGQPGAVIASLSGLQATSRVQTGVILFGTHEYMFTIDIDPAIIVPSSGTYWIELYNNSSPSGNFYWETGNLDVTHGIVGSAWFTTTPGTSWNLDGATDLSIQVNGQDDVLPCPVSAPTNPTPADNATNVGLNADLSWTNGAGTTNVEVIFDGATVYTGAPITTWDPGTLSYATTYTWKVICNNDTCGTPGPTWTFQTMQDPNLIQWCDDFANLNNWTIIGPLGMGNWSAAASSSAGGTPPELRMSWTPSFVGESKIRSVTIPLLDSWLTTYSFNYYFDWFADPSGTVTVALTYDGGATSTAFYSQVDATGNVGPLVVTGSFTTPASGSQNAQLEITFNGDSFNNDNIYWDNLCLDQIVPVELTSFTATANFGVVELSWITATETNNQGFEVQRSAGGEFETIAFVEGHGTTTETQAYAYSDRSVNVGSYSYRLKQIDFDGTFDYSNVVEADVPAPAEFALDQNYPNPFNPSTKIAFRLAIDSKVSLKVFDILGQEVATLVNTNLVAGAHNVNFDASSINSGVYLYRIEATGIDGTNFVDVKKMILTK